MTTPPLCPILGVHIAAVDMKTAINYIRENLSALRGKYICISNVHTTVMSYEQEAGICGGGPCDRAGFDAGDF